LIKIDSKYIVLEFILQINALLLNLNYSSNNPEKKKEKQKPKNDLLREHQGKLVIDCAS